MEPIYAIYAFKTGLVLSRTVFTQSNYCYTNYPSKLQSGAFSQIEPT